MQRGKGAPGPNPGHDWLHLSTYESLNQDLESQQVHAAGGIVIGYVINNTTSAKPAFGELLHGTMICKRSASSADVVPIRCSFLVVDSAKRANDMFKGHLSTSHKRVAKVYFTAESKNLDRYIVCYEALTAYPLDSKDKSMKKGKQTWQLATRQVFEGFHELQKAMYGRIDLCKSEQSKYLVYGKGNDNYEFPPIKKENNADILKIISVVPFNKNNDEARKRTLIDFLVSIEKCGVRELGDEYIAFQSLVEKRKRYNMPVLLRHPFTCCSFKERLEIVEILNEVLHNMTWEGLRNYETYMKDKLPNLIWQEKIKENQGTFACVLGDLDNDHSFSKLLTVLRNFITHQRDLALQRDINIRELHASVYRHFGAVLSWTYTYIYT